TGVEQVTGGLAARIEVVGGHQVGVGAVDPPVGQHHRDPGLGQRGRSVRTESTGTSSTPETCRLTSWVIDARSTSRSSSVWATVTEWFSPRAMRSISLMICMK